MESNTGPFVNRLKNLKGVAYLNMAMLLSMLTAFGPLCTDMYLPVLPDIASTFGISAALTQASITSCLLGLALGQVFIGPISDGKGRRGLLVLSLLVYTAASFLCAFSTSGLAFLGFRFLQGLGGAGGVVLARAVCCDTYEGPTLTQFMALLMALHCLAPILGPIAGGALAAIADWRLIFHVLGGIGVLLVFWTLLCIPETLDPAKRVVGGVGRSLLNTGRLFKEPPFLCYAGVQGFTMAGFFAYISASPFVFQNIYRLTPGEFSVLFGINATGVTVVSLLAGTLAKRFGDRAVLSVGNVLRFLACAGVLAVALLLPSSPLPMAVALFCLVSFQGLTMNSSFTMAILSQRTGAGAASGILGVAVFIFGSVTSPLAGLAGPESALPLGVICLATGLVALCCGLLGNRLYERCPAKVVKRLAPDGKKGG